MHVRKLIKYIQYVLAVSFVFVFSYLTGQNHSEQYSLKIKMPTAHADSPTRGYHYHPGSSSGDSPGGKDSGVGDSADDSTDDNSAGIDNSVDDDVNGLDSTNGSNDLMG